MNLTEKQKLICEQVINVFETGSVQGNYAAVTLLHDGPNHIRQVTYGRSQTTEYGNLQALLQLYVDSHGTLAEKFTPYLPQIRFHPLSGDQQFVQLLKAAGKNDPIMHKVQDDFFEKRYFRPAMKWATANGFILPLSALVIYDSHIHSGSIPGFLRDTFSEKPPRKGGDEKQWLMQYVNARQDWLANHSNPVLHPTVYRTKCFKKEITRNNWDLSKLPINANGIKVSGV